MLPSGSSSLQARHLFQQQSALLIGQASQQSIERGLKRFRARAVDLRGWIALEPVELGAIEPIGNHEHGDPDDKAQYSYDHAAEDQSLDCPAPRTALGA